MAAGVHWTSRASLHRSSPTTPGAAAIPAWWSVRDGVYPTQSDRVYQGLDPAVSARAGWERPGSVSGGEKPLLATPLLTARALLSSMPGARRRGARGAAVSGSVR